MKKVKILLREDFKHIVELSCPHDGQGVRKWCHQNKIPFIYYNSGPSWENRMSYAMTEESHAVWFKLRWS